MSKTGNERDPLLDLGHDRPQVPARARNLSPIVPRASIAGRALIAVVAIMTFLASITTGAVLLVSASAAEWQSDVASEITIQIRPKAGFTRRLQLARDVHVRGRIVPDQKPYPSSSSGCSPRPPSRRIATDSFAFGAQTRNSTAPSPTGTAPSGRCHGYSTVGVRVPRAAGKSRREAAGSARPRRAGRASRSAPPPRLPRCRHRTVTRVVVVCAA